MTAPATSGVSREARVQRARSAAEEAVRKAGAPFTQWVAFIWDSEGESVVKIFPREPFIAVTARKIATAQEPEFRAALCVLLETILAHPTMTPVIIMFAEGDREVAFMVPLLDRGMESEDGAGGGP